MSGMASAISKLERHHDDRNIDMLHLSRLKPNFSPPNIKSDVDESIAYAEAKVLAELGNYSHPTPDRSRRSHPDLWSEAEAQSEAEAEAEAEVGAGLKTELSTLQPNTLDLQSRDLQTLHDTSTPQKNKVSIEPLPPARRFHDPYKNPECLVPGNHARKPIYMYPFSGSKILPVHVDQSKEAIHLLYRYIHTNLAVSLADVDIECLVCGYCSETTWPGIIVRCDNEIMNNVRKILTQPDILAQCRLSSGVTQRSLLDWFRRIPSTTHSPPEARLPLYFYCGKPSNYLKGAEQPQRGDAPDDSIGWHKYSLAGVQIASQERDVFATISCVLKVDSIHCALVAAHVFCGDGFGPALLLHTTGTSPHSPDRNCSILQNDKDPINATVKLLPKDFHNINNPDLDWALVPLQEYLFDDRGGNNVSQPSQNENRTGVVAQHHPGENRDVLIITSTSIVQTGILLVGSMFRATRGTGIAELWSLELDDVEALCRGHSGSLVIDAATSQVYGYVISQDNFGRAHMVPLHAAISQIKVATRAKEVAIAAKVEFRPRIRKARSQSIVSSIREGNQEVADEAAYEQLVRLEALEQAVVKLRSPDELPKQLIEKLSHLAGEVKELQSHLAQEAEWLHKLMAQQSHLMREMEEIQSHSALAEGILRSRVDLLEQSFLDLRSRMEELSHMARVRQLRPRIDFGGRRIKKTGSPLLSSFNEQMPKSEKMDEAPSMYEDLDSDSFLPSGTMRKRKRVEGA